MKKLANYLIATALMAFTFTSCEDVPSPFGEIVKPDSGDVVVVDPTGSGTESDPYNVAAVIEYVSGLGADVQSTNEVYIKGIISEVQDVDVSGTYGNATYYISDDADGKTNKFMIYRGYGLGGKKFNEGATAIKVGDNVVIKSKVVNYKGNTPETVQNNCIIVELNGTKDSGGGGGTTPSGDAKGTGTADDPFNIAAAIKKCQEIGETVSTEKYYVKGIVVKGGTVSGGYGNLTFTLGDTKDATDIFTAFQVAGTDGQPLADGYQVNAGSEVVVYGPMYNYMGNTPETAGKSAAYIVTIDGKSTSEGGGGGGTPSGDATKVTVQEFLAAAESTDVWYELTGTIEHLEDGTYNNSTKYGNFDLVDETGRVYVYGVLSEKGGSKGQFEALMAAKNIKDGCKITIIGNRSSFKGDAQVGNAYFVKVEAGSGGGTDTPSGDVGTETNPYSVSAAIAKADQAGVYVKAFIVGWIDGKTLAEGAKFNGEATVNTNILIAESASETDVTKCMPVQLPSGNVRTGVNLKDNSGNYKQEVLLYGDITKYFGAPGLKNTSYAKIGSTEIGTKPSK